MRQSERRPVRWALCALGLALTATVVFGLADAGSVGAQASSWHVAPTQVGRLYGHELTPPHLSLAPPGDPLAAGGTSVDIWAMNADGSGQVNLTNDSYTDGEPAWSPDGKRITYTSLKPSGGQEISLMNADGSHKRSLTAGRDSDWSPDGTKIVFVRIGIWLINADGTGLTQLTGAAGDWAPSWSPDGQKIAFTRYVGIQHDVFVMNADGSSQTDLTNNPADDETPDWSPDGSRIVYSEYDAPSEQIYVMNADGSGQTNLSNSHYQDGAPAWSPDGTQIAFDRSVCNREEIYLMNADGSGQTRLTGSRPGHDMFPTWSPDGGHLAFERFSWSQPPSPPMPQIYAMNADGSHPTNLSNDPDAMHFTPAWSPDGTRIAFARLAFWDDQRCTNQQLYLMNPDGSDQTDLSNNHASDETPAWSPGGGRIAFGRTGDIYVMNADGSGQTALTNDPNTFDYAPTWSPDGSRIAFARVLGDDGTPEIYVMNADGSGQTELTDNPGGAIGPAWKPDGTKIAFAAGDKAGTLDIYAINPDGSGETDISNDRAWDSGPSWSPDGAKIAYSRWGQGDGNGEIYVMNGDGSGQTNLTHNRADDEYPTWSPGGTKIAFTSTRAASAPLPPNPGRLKSLWELLRPSRPRE